LGLILEPELLLTAYSQGFFPMAESKNGDIYWHSPDPRAIFNIYDIKPPRSVRQLINKKAFDITFNERFEDIIRACSERDDTWISEPIIESYINMHHLGHAQSLEVWQGDKLAGGLYGVTIGGAFFGESMFSEVSNASKVGFYYLIERLKKLGFILLDTQYINEHTYKLGAIEIPKSLYLKLLAQAIELPVSFRY
jgi:leucyl/phenylalanyl-tRNA---protein transferase